MFRYENVQYGNVQYAANTKKTFDWMIEYAANAKKAFDWMIEASLIVTGNQMRFPF